MWNVLRRPAHLLPVYDYNKINVSAVLRIQLKPDPEKSTGSRPTDIFKKTYKICIKKSVNKIVYKFFFNRHIIKTEL